MTKRQLWVVDTETTGLSEHSVLLEVAAVPVDGGDSFYFAPAITADDIANADPDALAINRYFERRVYQRTPGAPERNCSKLVELRNLLSGNTLGGSNPSFDAAVLRRAFAPHKAIADTPAWHHRLADLSAYAAGVLRMPPTELPGLDKVCELLGVVNREPHSAMGDAQATAECFRLLVDR